jgi:hypothetical protein
MNPVRFEMVQAGIAAVTLLLLVLQLQLETPAAALLA